MNPPDSPLLRLENLSLRVPDLEQSIDWYRDIVGLAEVARGENRIYLGVGDKPTWDLCLVEEAVDKGGTVLEYFSASVDDERVLAQVADRLRAADVEVTALSDVPPLTLAGIEFSLPGGFRMRAVVPAERSNYVLMGQKYLDADNLLRELHHINLAASDLEGLERFLVDNLDFAVSDHCLIGEGGPLSFAFWRINENHHDLAAVINNKDGLFHFAFGVPGVGQLVSIADRFASRNMRIVENGIGRHGAGNNLYLYVRDPSGNIVEFSADNPRITDRAAPTRIWTDPDLSGNMWGNIQPPHSFLETAT